MEADTRAQMASLLPWRYGMRDDVLCGADNDGTPIWIAGTIEGRPHVVTLLFFATDAFPKYALPTTRFVKKQLFPRYFEAGVHRMEAISLASYEKAHGWLRVLGLTPETGPLEGYGKRGEAFIQFSMARP